MISRIASVATSLSEEPGAAQAFLVNFQLNDSLSDFGEDELYDPSSMSSSTAADNWRFNSTLDGFFSAMGVGNSTNNSTTADIPSYIRISSMVFCIIIMFLGVVGNIMVPIVIMKTKDMRNSTNIFLMNLSIADLMVLLVCTPTVLVEVNNRPETWVLGKEMCLAVPFVELAVGHASVLTILAISFERYYAICEPLKAGYVCTKTRAALICFLAWFIAAVFTSPILGVATYHVDEYDDGSIIGSCFTEVDTFWPSFFFVSTIVAFFVIPLVILVVLYTIIARNLMENPAIITQNNKHNIISGGSALRYRKQVVMMLGTVVLTFFMCLLPYKALTLWFVIVSPESILALGVDGYYILVYFCRIMLYLNSAVNPILYNLMSSKFRDGFLKLLRLKKFKKLKRYKGDNIHRKDTFNTTTSTNYSSSQHTSDSFWRRYSSNKNSAQKSPQKSDSVKIDNTKKSRRHTAEKQKSFMVGDIIDVQNNRRNSMRFVSDIILVPKETIADNSVRNANLENYLDNNEDSVIGEHLEKYRTTGEKILKDAIIIEGLISSGDKRNILVRVPLLISSNNTTTFTNGISEHFGKESFV